MRIVQITMLNRGTLLQFGKSIQGVMKYSTANQRRPNTGRHSFTAEGVRNANILPFPTIVFYRDGTPGKGLREVKLTS